MCSLILAQEFQSAGVRGFVGKLSMDMSSRPTYVEESSSKSLSAAQSFIHRCNSLVSELPEHARLIEPVITPRFVPTCSDELLDGLGQLAAEHGTMVQSHMAEARDQVDWVRAERKMDDFEIFKKVRVRMSIRFTMSLSWIYRRFPLVAPLDTVWTVDFTNHPSTLYLSSGTTHQFP